MTGGVTGGVEGSGDAGPGSGRGAAGRPPRGRARAAMVETAVALLRERGVAGTSVDKVLAASGAPRGSVYHHFPGGRAQLLGEAVEFAERVILGHIRAARELEPVAALEAFVAYWRAELLDSGFGAGCPVLAVAVDEDPGHPELAARAEAAFAAWRRELAAMLSARGMDGERAETLALQVLCQIEGAVALCRAQRQIAPLDAAAEAVRALYAAAVR